MSDAREPGASASAMLSGLTHELRTPLNSILMLSELLEESLGAAGAAAGSRAPGEPAREARYARQIHQAAEDLLEVVNQAGELGRLDSGRLEVEAREVATADLARRIEEVARERDAPLVVERDPSAPEKVITDPAKLLRAVELLIAAAHHAAPPGSVAVRLEGASGRGLAIRITDAGPPLAEYERQTLFVPFGAAGPRTARRFGGTGLGLPVAHALANLLGATLTAEPGPQDQGCTFVLTLPA